MINAKILATVAALTLASSSINLSPGHPSSPAPVCHQNCKVDDDGYALIRNFEGYSPFPYRDTAGVLTIGFGHAIKPGETIQAPLIGTDAQKLLESDVSAKERAVNRLAKVPLRATQFDALASFTFNLGEGTLAKSTLLRKVNARQDEEVPAEFLRWTRAGGIELKGLYLRRKAEAALYVQETQ